MPLFSVPLKDKASTLLPEGFECWPLPCTKHKASGGGDSILPCSPRKAQL